MGLEEMVGDDGRSVSAPELHDFGLLRCFVSEVLVVALREEETRGHHLHR